MSEKPVPPPDDFGGYPGDDVSTGVVHHDDQDDELDLEDENNADARAEYIRGRLDDDPPPPTKGERRIIELTLRELGTAGAAAGLTAGEALSELAARTSDMLERVNGTLHDGVDEVFSALAEAHDASDKDALAATSKAREAAHKTVDELVQDLRGEE